MFVAWLEIVWVFDLICCLCKFALFGVCDASCWWFACYRWFAAWFADLIGGACLLLFRCWLCWWFCLRFGLAILRYSSLCFDLVVSRLFLWMLRLGVLCIKSL